MPIDRRLPDRLGPYFAIAMPVFLAVVGARLP